MEKELFQQRLSELETLLHDTVSVLEFSPSISSSFNIKYSFIADELESLKNFEPNVADLEQRLLNLEEWVVKEIAEHLTKAAKKAHINWSFSENSSAKNPIQLISPQLEAFHKLYEIKSTKKKKKSQPTHKAAESTKNVSNNDSEKSKDNLKISDELIKAKEIKKAFDAHLEEAKKIILSSQSESTNANNVLDHLLQLFKQNSKEINTLEEAYQQHWWKADLN